MVQLQIQAVQTVMPTKQTDPRQFLKVTFPDQSLASVLQQRFNIVLCYQKASDEDSGWVVAGWIKESLSRALAEQPLFAGRLRRNEEGGEDWHIVSNDSGVRLVESRVDMKMAEFLSLQDKSEVEGELVFWEDVVEHDPQFSPLFYVQVTNFSCGGYSVGISCSMVLADPFVLKSFINIWSNLHTKLVPDGSKLPTFYLANSVQHGPPLTLLMGSKTEKNSGESVIFEIPRKAFESGVNVHKNLAVLCIGEAERVTGRKMGEKFSLFVKTTTGDVKTEVCTREEVLEKPIGIELNCVSMSDGVKVDKICFNETNQPGYGSCWINSVLGEGCVLITGPDVGNMKIVVTLN